jgi:choline dehydrogenase-like flavoprotein
MPDAIVIGSGAAGSVAAWELARAGWHVTVLERGRNLRPGLGEVPSGDLGTLHSSDEIKGARHFGFPDPILEPYSARTQQEADGGTERSSVGAHGQLGSAVGGTSLHYNAKFPRFWRQDFTTLSDLGPIEGAQVADWPISYEDLAPYYNEVEYRVGVQGSVDDMPARTLEQTPRDLPLPMPPSPIAYVAQLLAQGAAAIGWKAYPYPAAVNSTEYDGRPACVSCGLCSGFGCPINARGDALVSWLNPAMLTGRVRVIPRALVHRIRTNAAGTRATGVSWRDQEGTDHHLTADAYVIAGSPINTARLLLLSANNAHPGGLGNRSDQVGRNMMFHNFVQGASVFPNDVHPLRAASTTLVSDDLVGPFTGPDVQATGLPWIKGGLIQVGSGAPPVQASSILAGFLGHGLLLKQLLNRGILHRHVGGTQLIIEDLPQADNRVDLDPGVHDHLGLPSARITYSPHLHEQRAAVVLGARLEAMHLATPGATGSLILPYPLMNDGATYTAHLAGTARMGTDPDTSVTDPDGRLHEVDNVWVVDGSTFPTFPGFNPTLTIMANSLRVTRALTGAEAPPQPTPPGQVPTPTTGGGLAAAGVATVGAAAAIRAATRDR